MKWLFKLVSLWKNSGKRFPDSTTRVGTPTAPSSHWDFPQPPRCVIVCPKCAKGHYREYTDIVINSNGVKWWFNDECPHCHKVTTHPTHTDWWRQHSLTIEEMVRRGARHYAIEPDSLDEGVPDAPPIDRDWVANSLIDLQNMNDEEFSAMIERGCK